jgi:hypothetical protein
VKININLLTILDLSIAYSRSKVVPLRAAKAYGGVEVRFHSFLPSELDKSERSTSRPVPLSPTKQLLVSTEQKKARRAPTDGMVILESTKIYPPLQRIALLLGLPARSLVTVPTKLLRLLECLLR